MRLFWFNVKSVPENIEISTLRCVLRALCETDIPGIVSAMGDPGIADAVRWSLPRDTVGLFTVIRASEARWRAGSGFHFSILARAGGNLLGGVQLRQEPRARDWNIGFWISRLHWGQGYAVEAARAATEFAFQDLRALTVRAACLAENIQSRRVIEKLGMRFNRQLAAGVGVQGWVSEYEYAIEKN
jgi:ribosomal-protein-alanine N-acetyltransferase